MSLIEDIKALRELTCLSLMNGRFVSTENTTSFGKSCLERILATTFPTEDSERQVPGYAESEKAWIRAAVLNGERISRIYDHEDVKEARATFDEILREVARRVYYDWIAEGLPIPEDHVSSIRCVRVTRSDVLDENGARVPLKSTSLHSGIRALYERVIWARRFMPDQEHYQHWNTPEFVWSKIRQPERTVEDRKIQNLVVAACIGNFVVGFLWTSYEISEDDVYVVAWYVVGAQKSTRGRTELSTELYELAEKTGDQDDALSSKAATCVLTDLASKIGRTAVRSLENEAKGKGVSSPRVNIVTEVDAGAIAKKRLSFRLKGRLFSRISLDVFGNAGTDLTPQFRILDVTYTSPGLRGTNEAERRNALQPTRYVLLWACSHGTPESISKKRLKEIVDFLYRTYTVEGKSDADVLRKPDAIRELRQAALASVSGRCGCVAINKWLSAKKAFEGLNYGDVASHEFLKHSDPSISVLSCRKLHRAFPEFAESIIRGYRSENVGHEGAFTLSFPDEDREELEDTLRYITDPRNMSDVVLLMRDGQAVAGSHYYILATDDHMFGVEYYLCVHPNFRGQEYGTFLYKCVRDLMQSYGCSFIVGEMRDPSLRFGHATDSEADRNRASFWEKNKRRTFKTRYTPPPVKEGDEPLPGYVLTVESWEPLPRQAGHEGLPKASFLSMLREVFINYSDDEVWKTSFALNEADAPDFVQIVSLKAEDPSL